MDTRLVVGQNGFGRFGLNVLKSWIDDEKSPYTIRFINDEKLSAQDIYQILISDPLVDFKKYKITLEGQILTILTAEGRTEQLHCTKLPADQIDWLGIPAIILECSGTRTLRERCQVFLTGNTKVVIISATSYDADGTFLAGYNHTEFQFNKHQVISFGSCTVNAYVPLAAYINSTFGIKESMVNVIHNIQRYHLPKFNTLQRKFCTLERMGPVFLPFLNKDNFIVNYTVIPYEGVSIIDFAFHLKCKLSKNEFVDFLQTAVGRSGPLQGLYGVTQKDTGPEVHIGTSYSSVLIEEGIQVRNETVHLFAYFYNEGTARYHQLVSYVAKQFLPRSSASKLSLKEEAFVAT